MTNQLHEWECLQRQHLWYPMVSTAYVGGYVVGSTTWVCLTCGMVQSTYAVRAGREEAAE